MKFHVQIANWLASYQRDWLKADLVAGLTAAAVVIPKAMGTAVIAGLPVEIGLYAALAAMVIYPLLGGSRPLSVTATSAIAMLTATQVAALADTGVPAITVASTLALMTGAVLLACSVLRLGFLANFISAPVLVGFEAGVGIVVVVGQLKSLLGVSLTSSSTLGILAEIPKVFPQAHVPTVLVAAAGLAVLYGLPRIAPRVPAPLVWVAASIAASAVLGLQQVGVKTVGAVPPGLPSLAMPDLSLVGALWPAALGIALMSFTESVASARAALHKGDPPIVANRELVAVGTANVVSGLFTGMPAGGSASQTALTDKAGARSQMAQWVNAGAVLLTLLLLSRLIAMLPQAALGTLVLVAAAGMVKPQEFRAIARVRRMELMWAIATLVGVVVIGTLQGILIAVVISLLSLIFLANHPPVYVVAYNPDKDFFSRSGDYPGEQTYPGLLLLRSEGRVTFANAANVGAKMQELLAQQSVPPRFIVLECSAIPDIEFTALKMLTEAEEKLRAEGVTLCLAGVNSDMRKVLDRTGLGKTLGEQRIFPNLFKVVEAWKSGAMPSLPPREQPAAPALVPAGGVVS